MPIVTHTPIRRLSQAEFGDLAYGVMGCIFEIHCEFGRFFDEKIYKRELAHRYPGVELEVRIDATHGAFTKAHYIDALVQGGGVFEMKTVDALAPRHSAQLLHYLLLAELGHGKLVNLKKDTVEHEFVNSALSRADRIRFAISDSGWSDRVPGAAGFRDILTELLRDWGTGLDLQLYEEGVTYFLGGQNRVLAEAEVFTSNYSLGHQRIHLAAPGVAFLLTALHEGESNFETHIHRFLSHTNLEAVLWANISLKRVRFTRITAQRTARTATEK